MAHTAMGKDLLPRVAALLDGGVITDVVAVGFEGGAFTAKKPVFAGKATMTVKATTKRRSAPRCARTTSPASGWRQHRRTAEGRGPGR
jgi:electron transfer flavoprotein alpha subunit